MNGMLVCSTGSMNVAVGLGPQPTAKENCVNCGAPPDLTSRCAYCGSAPQSDEMLTTGTLRSSFPCALSTAGI